MGLHVTKLKGINALERRCMIALNARTSPLSCSKCNNMLSSPMRSRPARHSPLLFE